MASDKYCLTCGKVIQKPFRRSRYCSDNCRTVRSDNLWVERLGIGTVEEAVRQELERRADAPEKEGD